ncbi:MAG: hypothetical protein IKL10_04740 [Clostridia bacterium]|nr:hypothetical protein [Clostridia bacterium]
MSFKDSIIADNNNVFLNANEFADLRTVKYDGKYYCDIPIVLSSSKEKKRKKSSSERTQGLYSVSAVLHCSKADLGGLRPEQGQRLSVNNEEGGGGFFREFYVISSSLEDGMLRIELEAIDE